MKIVATKLLVFSGLLSLSCGGLEGPKPPSEPDLEGHQCPLFERDPTKEPDLMAWDATEREKVSGQMSEGVVALHVEREGCDVQARVLDCVGKVAGETDVYTFKSYYARKRIEADSVDDAYAKLPLGAASVSAGLGRGKSLRVDFVMVGAYKMPTGKGDRDIKWVGRECGERTHLVSRIVVGGFALATGEREKVKAAAGVFGMGAGAERRSSRVNWRVEGQPRACQRASESDGRARGCEVPLRLELVSLGRGRKKVEATIPAGRVAARGSEKARVSRPSAAAVSHEGTTSVGGYPGMKRIPGGTFMMGSNDGDSDEKPVHEVTVRTFWMDETEVTVDAYKNCVDAGVCATPDTADWFDNWGKPGRGNHPVNGVSWVDADKYCKWLGKRLPTEEEWEYAARGGAKQWKYPWGNSAPGSQLCWNGAGSDKGKGNRKSTCPVGSYPAGAFGLKDMAGNVREWISSWYSDSYSKKRVKITRIARGGGWSDDDPSYFCGAERGAGTPSDRINVLGFRCARF